MTNSPEYSLEKAKAYQKQKQKLSFLHLFLSPAILLAVIATPLSFYFKQWAVSIYAQPYLSFALYFLFFSLFMLIFDLPLGFYSGFVLEHQYELSNQTLRTWILDFFKKSILSFAFSLVLLMALYALIWNLPGTWWVWAWAGFAAVSYGMGKLFPVLIVPLFYKYGKVEDQSLKDRILKLAARYALPVENVYSINLSKTTKKANAAFMGMGKTKRVVLSDTLIEKFTGDEIETVVAHELGHYKHHDIWKQLIFGLLASFAGFWLVFRAIDPAAHFFDLGGAGDIAAMPLVFLIFYFFYLILTPVQNGFSRIVERAADRFALEAFPRPDAFISCMDKLGKVNLADPQPNPFIEWFFYDHPAIGKRIQMAREWKK